ncbi:MAG: S-layer homology domain-containing protein [Oscillospiraceae bacterium]|nr:S-layer homology domain-containing protein [Oscillospiraceae bacterium]
MKRLLYLLLACALAALTGPVLAAGPDESAPEHDGYLVSMAEPLDPALAEAAGCEAVSDSLYYAETVWDAGALARLGKVDYMATNDILSTQDSFDGYETELWNLRSVEASAAWNHRDESGARDRLGDGVTVAVVDSGVMAEHPDLAGANILDYVALSSETDGVDDYHGTFISGILAAGVNNGIDVDGMVPNVSILPICITHNGGKTDVKTAVAGINKAVELGADVITFSIGGTRDNDALREVCQNAADKGVILVTCAGNYSAGTPKSADRYMYPAAYDSVVTVSACKQEGEGVAFDDSYSYFNDGVTVSAPGTDITSLYLDGRTVTRSGTSFAAPVVTSMAIMAKQADRDINTDGYIELLKASSIDMGEPGFDPYYGYGYVNVPAFLDALDEADFPPVYSDVPADAWYYDSVSWVSGRGIMNGTGQGCFSPDGDTSRAMMVTILWRAAGEPSATEPLSFADVPEGTWYTEAVRWAAQEHIVDGYSPESFGPDDPITREQLATILYRSALRQGADAESSAELDGFADADTVSPWAAEAMRWAVGAGLINGMGDGSLSPRTQASRAQVAAIIMRFSENNAV